MQNILIIVFFGLFLIISVYIIYFFWFVKNYDIVRKNVKIVNNNGNNTSAYFVRHLGVIMDGNRRWAKAHNTDYVKGYSAGGQKFFDTLLICLEEDVAVITIWALTRDNFENRTIEEIYDLLEAVSNILQKKRDWFREHGIKIKIYGEKEICDLKGDIRDVIRNKARELYTIIDEICKDTAEGSRLVCNLLVGYHPIDDLVHSAKSIVEKITTGEIKKNDIDREMICKLMRTGDVPPVDLILRTGGANRLSGFVPIQSMYSEIEVINTMWPDVSLDHIRQLIKTFPLRARNFGK